MEIIKAKNEGYAKYEEVLLRRDRLRKEAELHHLAFLREFGDLIAEAFRMKVECIRKKKMIAFCQRQVNQRKDISKNALTAFIEKEMQEYREELEGIIKDVKAVKEAEQISPAKVKKIKELYHTQAKRIHPDLHPELAEDEVLREYWQRIVTAYRYNQLEELEELSDLVLVYLDGKDPNAAPFELQGLDKKIRKVEAEIEEILSTYPYRYKLLLNDPEERKEKRQEYREEIASYEQYAAQLDEVLSTFEIKEMLS